MSMPQPRPLLPFFGLVFALSVPFWVLGYFADSLSDLIPIDLPVSALMAFLPATAALILVWRETGGQPRAISSSVHSTIAVSQARAGMRWRCCSCRSRFSSPGSR